MSEAKKANLYAVELWHEVNVSPFGNNAYRKISAESRELLPKMLAEHGLKSHGLFHLRPGNRALFILEGESVEDVRDALYKSKLMHWNDGQIFPVSRLYDAAKRKTSGVPAAVVSSAKAV